MQYHQAELLISAASPAQFPDSGLPEVLFAGRSNVGKSSLINVLLNRKNLAYTGRQPGRTQLLNFYEVDHRLLFVDAPGYGYAGGGQKQALAFGAVMEPYVTERAQLRLVVLLLDGRRVPGVEDLQMAEAVRQRHRPLLAVLTKADKLNQSQRVQAVRKAAETLQIPAGSFLPVSARNRQGIEELWNQISHYID